MSYLARIVAGWRIVLSATCAARLVQLLIRWKHTWKRCISSRMKDTFVRFVRNIVKLNMLFIVIVAGIINPKTIDENKSLNMICWGCTMYSIAGLVSSVEDFDSYIVKEAESQGYYCSLCSLYGKRGRTDVRDHIESRHFPGTFSYNCLQCNQTLPTNKALKRHKQKHKIVLWFMRLIALSQPRFC